MSTSTYPIGIIGVGNMGGGMARRLLGLGWPVWVNDLDADKMAALQRLGAQAAPDKAQLAARTELLIVCVVDAEQAREALFGPGGAVAALAPERCVMLCPTIAPEDVEELAARLAERGLAVIDAPMSGGPARATEGTMSLMVACDPALYAQRRALLDALSNKLFHVSARVGDGARTKLVNNLLAGINLVGAAEALALARAMGIDAATTLDVIEQSSGQSWIGSDRLRRALAEDYAPRAHMTLLAKDTALAVGAARAAGFAGPLGARAADTFARALQAGLADEDDAALYKLLQKG